MNGKKVPPALKWIAATLAAIVAGTVLFLAFFDWDVLRRPIARLVAERIERPVSLRGLNVQLLAVRPRIEVEGLTIGNPAWMGGGNMVELGRVTVEFKRWPLLIGELVILSADIEKPVVRLMRDASKRANWEFGPKKPPEARAQPIDLPVIRRFTLQDGNITMTDEARKLNFNGTVNAGESISGADAYPFRLTGQGKLNNKPFELSVNGGPLVNVRRFRPYAFEAGIRAGATRLHAKGSIARPFDLARLQAALTITGDDLADVYYLTGLALPNTPPYKVSGHLQRAGTRFRIEDFKGKVGDSDVNGALSIETATGRPALKAELISKSLDLDDMLAPLGAAPQGREEPGGTEETISAKQRELDRTMAAQKRLFPDAQLQVERVRGMDADVKFKATAVKARRIPMKQVSFQLHLKDGVLQAEPVSFVLPQGKFSGSVRLDARSDTPRSAIDFRVTGVDLQQFKPRNGQPPLTGTLLGRIKLQGQGDSVREVVATGDGSVTVIVPQGGIREAFAELTGINVARGLGLLLSKDQEQVNVRCGVADFALRDGNLSAKVLVFDTEDVLITGEGKIELDSETADMTVKGQPKKLRLLRVRAPISIKGPLRKPEIGIEGEKTAAQGAFAAALAALAAPLAAVVAFVDPGLAEDADCGALLAEAKESGAPIQTHLRPEGRREGRGRGE